MKELTQEEKRVRIAEACGWIFKPNEFGWSFAKLDREGPWRKYGVGEEPFPDYFNDLNAMNEAEKILKSTKKDTWHKRLVEITNGWSIGELDRDCDFSISSIMNAFSATAAQRAEAFGRALNLW